MAGDVINLRPALTAADLRTAAAQAQLQATDPAASAWVPANAGTGKTYVLVRRILRLMLSGADPQTVLCLTFTNAAAAEMASRLLAELGAWTAKPEDELRQTLEELLGRPAGADDLRLARRLFAQVIDTPGGLKIMTIHGFCGQVLRRFPLEADVPANFTALDESEARILLQEAAAAVLTDAAAQARSPLGQALTVVIAHAGETRFHELLEDVLGQSEALQALIQQQRGHEGCGLDAAAQSLLHEFGLKPEETCEALIAAQCGLCTDALLADAAAMLQAGAKKDQDPAKNLAAVRAASDPDAKAAALFNFFLTKEGAARSDAAGSFITQAVRKRHPQLCEALRQARDRYAELERKLRAKRMIDASGALLRLADGIFARYEAFKSAKGALDYDDLIAKTASLLLDDRANAWVLYRLDNGIDHVLVDEAQDTSPAQWEVIKRLTAEFFAGDGARQGQRTVFAVGDEKQSIYGFQGAAPEQFAQMGRDFRQRAQAAGQDWRYAPLTLSFRSAAPVLSAVDRVFADPASVPGLSADRRAPRHSCHREGEPGLVEIWPAEKPERNLAGNVWEPPAEQKQGAKPADRLAARIADQIKAWLDGREWSQARGRPVRAGDILILVRRRKPFAEPMVAALKQRGIPVAGADRMRLNEQLAVMDLMSLGDFMLMPEDDLTLATLLKSPLFDFDDDDLFALAYKRSCSLWNALKSAGHPRYQEAADRLRGWLRQADQMPPFEFFTQRLEHGGAAWLLLRRLGPESADAIDEFVNLALQYEGLEPPSLQGFLHWLRRRDSQIKRDMEQGRDEVRVMTVHGAKGLEADIVFLADTCSCRGKAPAAVLPLQPRHAPLGAPKHLIWAAPGSDILPEIAEARETAKRRERQEYHRLLYVAMTRARDRLYVTGFETVKGRDKGCWYDLIRSGLDGVAREAVNESGATVWRFESTAAVTARRMVPEAMPIFTAPPEWINKPAPKEAAAARTLTPSTLLTKRGARAGVLSLPGEARVTPVANGQRGEAALLRGRLAHRLLELLPDIPAARREEAARRFIAARGAALPGAGQEDLLRAVLTILGHPDFAPLFGQHSRAEAGFAAKLESPEPGAPPLHISGQADRLAVLDDEVLIADYKTDQRVPRTAEEAPAAYVMQLAAYRLALQAIYPHKRLRAALIWIESPRMMEIPAALLDRFAAHLLTKQGVQGLTGREAVPSFWCIDANV